MFNTFQNREGTAYIELQYCKLEKSSKLKKIVNKIKYWSNDSLFIKSDEIDNFINMYCDIIGYGIYNNLKNGLVDPFGINYYKPENIEEIQFRLKENKPKEYEILYDWLEKGKKYNGFYILGL